MHVELRTPQGRVGVVRLKDGVAVGSNAKARQTMAETVVVEPDSKVTVTPANGERYLLALSDSVSSGPYFWATFVDLEDAAMKSEANQALLKSWRCTSITSTKGTQIIFLPGPQGGGCPVRRGTSRRSRCDSGENTGRVRGMGRRLLDPRRRLNV